MVWWHRDRRGREEGQDAKRAVAASSRELAATRLLTPEVDELARKFRQFRRENHFSERIVEMLTDPGDRRGR